MSLEETQKLIKEAIELQRQINSLNQTICRNNRSEARFTTKSSINNYENYFNNPNHLDTGKIYMINPKHIEELRKKPYSCRRKQLNPTRGISKAEFNSVIKMPNFTKAIDRNAPDMDYLLPLYNISPLLEMTAYEIAEAIRFCEEEISQEKLEQSIMYALPDINLKEARHFLANVDWMKI
jgi:hypothetical protein